MVVLVVAAAVVAAWCHHGGSHDGGEPDNLGTTTCLSRHFGRIAKFQAKVQLFPF